MTTTKDTPLAKFRDELKAAIERDIADYRRLAPKVAAARDREDQGKAPTAAQRAAIEEIERRWGPDGPGDDSFDDLRTTLANRFDPTKSTIAMRRFLETKEAWTNSPDDDLDLAENIREPVEETWHALAAKTFRDLWEKYEEKLDSV